MTGSACIDEAGSVGVPGLYLLFAGGHLPDSAAVAAALAAMPRAHVLAASDQDTSLDHVASPARRGDRVETLVEILFDGLTFDLLGLEVDASISPPPVVHHFNVDPNDLAGCSAIALCPGPHIADGAHALPIVRTMMHLAANLARGLPGIRALCWSPARSAISPGFFTRSVEAWLGGGPFPALGLIGMHYDAGGGLLTEGLRFFIGSEVLITPEVGVERLAATRLAVRLAHELIGSEPPGESRAFLSEEVGALVLEPAMENRLIKIRPG